MKRVIDKQGLAAVDGEYQHPEPPWSRNTEWVRPASFYKLKKAKVILMAVPGGWEEVSLPEDYKDLFKGVKSRPRNLHVMWKGNRIPASLTGLRIPKLHKEKNIGGGWFGEK